MSVRNLIALVSDNLQEKREKREQEHAEWRESLRKPVWCERFKGKYDAALYWNSFPADDYGDPWPLYVFEVGTGKVIGIRHIDPPIHHAHATNFPVYRQRAEKIIADHERWASVPEDEQPLRPLDDVAEK